MRNRIPLLVLSALTLIIALVMWSSRLSYPIDDTFITFRYAENLANGFGLVWNHGGIPTEGYTNFLFVLLLAPFAELNFDLLVVAQVMNVFAIGIAAIYIYLIGVKLADRHSWLAILPSVLFLATPAVWANALSGMETVLFGMLLLAGFYHVWSNETRIRTLGYALLFLASLTRPEGAVLAVLLGVAQLVTESRRKTLRALLLGVVLPIIVYYISKKLYFGYWLPNSFAVKVTQSVSGSQGFLQGLQAVKLFVLRVWPLLIMAFVPIAFTKSRLYLAAIAWALIVIAAYAVPAPLMGFFDRFFFSSEVFLFVLAGFALVLIDQRYGRRLSLVCSGVLTALLIITNTQSPRATEILTWDLSEINERLEMIAIDLRSLPHANTITFATSDAGIMPYRSGMKHLDLAGLNDTKIAHSNSTQDVIDRTMDVRPEVLLLSADWSSAGADDTCRRIARKVHGKLSTSVDQLLMDPRFQHYRPTAAYLTGVYDYAVMLDTRSPKFLALDSAYRSRISANMFYLKRLTCIN